jgi:hypothetical protein
MSDITSDVGSAAYITIPKLAKRLGVTPASVRAWVLRGYIEPPSELPVTGEHAYSQAEANSIEVWYMQRAANRGTRGPGAAIRREHARHWLTARQIDAGAK